MIHIIEGLYIGDSADGEHAGRGLVANVLNVADDMDLDLREKNVRYAKLGLVDGPGNSIDDYLSAALALSGLWSKGSTLVCCHTGRRSLVVVVMCLAASNPRSWDDILELIRERTDRDVPDLGQAHREAFDRIDWNEVSRWRR